MSFTMTRTVSESFTLTHSKYLASKVTSDMLRCQQSYGKPSNDEINNYGTELAMLMRDGYVSAYEFGFSNSDKRIISWKYSVVGSELTGTDDRPGKILSGVDVSAATFFNQLTYSQAWSNLSEVERAKIDSGLPIHRQIKNGPTDGAGYWQQDRCYYSNGISMPRSTFRPY